MSHFAGNHPTSPNMHSSERDSGEIPTRFSTPVPDLDDHRQQALAVPSSPEVAQSPHPEESRGRKISISTLSKRERMLAVDKGTLLSPVSRDFENAIVDSDVEEAKPNSSLPQASTPGLGQGASKRMQQQQLGNAGRSRETSPSSSRSSSPPNSVDAFAEPRLRERANTYGSREPSLSNAPIARTISGGTHNRRPTHSSIDPKPIIDRPEEDVCFPQVEEPTKTFSIDFEEIEEFVAEAQRDRPAGVRQRKHSFSSAGGILKDSKTNGVSAKLDPFSQRQRLTSSESAVNSLKPADDEKTDGGEKVAGGTDPNRFSFFSSEIEKTVHAPELGDLLVDDESFRDLFDLPADTGAWWLDVMNPTEDELEMFQKAFGIHRLTAEDIECQESREKVELFQKYYFVCFRSFAQMDKKAEDYLKPVNVYMVVFREGILTFSYAPNPHAAEVRKRIGKLRNYINLTADWICYALIDNIVDSFGPVIRDIELQTDTIDDQVFTTRMEDFSALLREIGECRKKVTSLMRLLGGKADVIKGFAKRCNEQYVVTPRGEIGLYLGDIQDHVVTMMSNLGHFDKMLSRSHGNHLAQLSVDQIAQGTRANANLGRLTAVGTVLIPLNVVCGVFGMNVPVPGGVNEGELYWFGGIVGFMALFTICSLTIMKFMRVW